MGAERSTPSTSAAVPAARRVVLPQPQPTSSTCSLAAGAAAASRCGVSGRSMASYRRRLAAQCIPSGPFQAGGLVEVMTALYESPAEGEAEGSWAALPRLGHAW